MKIIKRIKRPYQPHPSGKVRVLIQAYDASGRYIVGSEISRHITLVETSVEEIYNIILSALEQKADGEIILGLKSRKKLLETKKKEEADEWRKSS